jgi:plastocyanin
MSEFDPEDYTDKLTQLKEPNGISAAWVVMVLVAVLFIGLNRYLGGATEILWQAEPAAEETSVHHMILHHHTFEPAVVLVHPRDRIVLSNEDADVHALAVIDHEEILEDEVIEPETSFAFVVPAGLARGEYVLTCTIHSEMRAKIVVSAAPAPSPAAKPAE